LHRSSSTISPTPRIWVPRHLERLVTRLIVDYSVRRDFVLATLALLQPRRGARLLALRQHWLYFKYAARRHDIVFRSHRVDHSSRLIFQLVKNGSHAPSNWSESTLTSQLQQQPSWLHRRPPRLQQQSAQAATAKSFI
jgi:hypothetical protein